MEDTVIELKSSFVPSLSSYNLLH